MKRRSRRVFSGELKLHFQQFFHLNFRLEGKFWIQFLSEKIIIIITWREDPEQSWDILFKVSRTVSSLLQNALFSSQLWNHHARYVEDIFMVMNKADDDIFMVINKVDDEIIYDHGYISMIMNKVYDDIIKWREDPEQSLL